MPERFFQHISPLSPSRTAFLALALLLSLCLPAGAASLKPGDRAPLFVVKDLTGAEISLRDRVGPLRKYDKRGVILVFFATWCPSCREELPLIDALAPEFKTRNIDIIIIGYQEGPKELETFLRLIGVKNLTAGADVSGEIGERYGLHALPTLFVIAADGMVRKSLVGEADDIQSYLRKAADGLAGK